MTRLRAIPLPLIFSTLVACNSGGGGGSPAPTPPPATSDPCANVSLTEALAPANEALAEAKRQFVDGSTRYNVLDALALSRARARRGPPAVDVQPEGVANRLDIGEIAIIQDEGDVIAPPNPFDLRGAGVRFTANADGGYDARRIDGAFRTTVGRALALGDDDSTAEASTFGFRFYGQSHTTVFINSDGNLTFVEEDRASTERNVARLVTGPPRIAPFLADLDPSVAGRIFVHAAADQFTVTWCNVRGFDSQRAISTQVSLLPDGAIEFKYGTSTTSLGDAVVGVSPGRTGDFTPVSLSETGPNGGPAAVGERFAEQVQLDALAAIEKFYRTHPDNYDQIVLWTDVPLVRNAFAYEVTVANAVRGIGVPIYDASRDFGSAGRLRSYAVMDWIGKYPESPAQMFLGENSTLSLLAHESGHQWLAFLEFRDHTGIRSTQLLGRDEAHWSFFFDSDASVMEGNDIEDLGGGSFRTAGAVNRYSLLDQYAMGLVPEQQVPPFFYVQNPANMSATRTRESAPQTGITFNGTRREVLIQDVIAIHGPRVPSVADSPRIHRQAFVFLVSAGRQVDGTVVAKIDRIRLLWEPYFLAATDGRMQVITRLQ